jgi:hypothetical protein
VNAGAQKQTPLKDNQEIAMDLAIVLRDWPYDEHENANNIRKIVGLDGAQKLQIRVRNGVIQWEINGRPDGQRPYGFDSVLEYCLHLSSSFDEFDTPGDEDGFCLEGQLLRELNAELKDYGRRRQALMLVSDYGRALSDALHTERILDVIRDHARPPAVKKAEQRRPLVVGARTRAEALKAIRDDELRRALGVLTAGIQEIEVLFEQRGAPEALCRCRPRRILVDLRRSLRERYHIPLTDRELLQTLRSEQKVAVEQEDFEMAASLRDKINGLLARNENRH